TGGSAPGGDGTPAPRGPVTLDGRVAILAAAEQAERQPVGRYWHVDEIQGQSYIMRPKTGTYAITGAHSELFAWRGARSGMGEAYYERDLPARPLTERDAALWRRAGSPASFRVWSNDAYHTYTTGMTRWKVKRDAGGGGEFVLGKSVEDLQNLPTDPARLTEMFLSTPEMKRMAGIPAEKPLSERMDVPGSKIIRVAGLLNEPIPPKVRAGLMRALAAQPGIHAIGRVTDPLGRPGVALASDDRPTTITGEFGTPKAQQGTYRSRNVLVFDERTGALLSDQVMLTSPGGPYAEMKPGFVIYYNLLRSAAWTDTKPTPPAAPPFD
ncbi:MAG TPA: hypothetical protein VHJ17_07750, partial [Thermomonospora sp.]|nr:hypothetical protein [Thermomonospora sp.]